MNFTDSLLLIVMILIFIVIIFNLFTYGKDLVIFPPRMRRVPLEDRYPGSPEYDEYTDDDSSDDDSSDDDSSDDNDYSHRRRDRHRKRVHPNRIASYVASHMPQ